MTRRTPSREPIKLTMVLSRGGQEVRFDGLVESGKSANDVAAVAKTMFGKLFRQISSSRSR